MNLPFHYVATTTGFTGMATRSENIGDLQRCPHRKIRDDRDVGWIRQILTAHPRAAPAGCEPRLSGLLFILALAAMAETNAKRKCFLSQRPLGALRQLCDLDDGRLRFRVRPQLFNVSFGVFATRDLLCLLCLLCRLGHSMLLIFWSALLSQIPYQANPLSRDKTLLMTHLGASHAA
jgi:hypothetical protein